jgi:hypothetical protein
MVQKALDSVGAMRSNWGELWRKDDICLEVPTFCPISVHPVQFLYTKRANPMRCARLTCVKLRQCINLGRLALKDVQAKRKGHPEPPPANEASSLNA